VKNKVIISVVGVIILASLFMIFMYGLRFLNAATLQTKVINPKPGVECVVVSATDSTSVDCWPAPQRG
jgi:hypothetical protein